VRVLFCSNELVRTGAPLILAEYVPAMGFDATVYCRTDGPLRETFEVNGCRVTDRLDVRGFDVVHPPPAHFLDDSDLYESLFSLVL
jgi:predicted peroxiredoxin